MTWILKSFAICFIAAKTAAKIVSELLDTESPVNETNYDPQPETTGQRCNHVPNAPGVWVPCNRSLGHSGSCDYRLDVGVQVTPEPPPKRDLSDAKLPPEERAAQQRRRSRKRGESTG